MRAGWLLLLVATVGCPPAPPAPSGYTVRLVGAGQTPEAVVAAVRSATGYTEVVARKLVEQSGTAGVPVGTGLEREQAEAVAAALRAAGGEANVLRVGGQ